MKTNKENPGKFERKEPVDQSQIKGWGTDADKMNDPTYPIKSRMNLEHQGYTWERPPLQQPRVEILHSNERPDVTATFGSPNPPSGVSGKLRRKAFKASESSYGHWVPLILADRINVVEGFIDDIRHGHVPNIFSELGWAAEWKYNKKSFVRRAVTAAIVATALALLFRKKKSKN